MTGNPQNNALAPGEVGIREATADTLDFCDRLPELLRRLMKFAPFDYAMRPWIEDYVEASRGGASVEQIAAAWVRRIRAYTVKAAIRDYGPEHPQAQVRQSPTSQKGRVDAP